MKTMSVLAVVLVLTASLLVGCGCRNNVPATQPTTMPTVATTMPTTEVTTVPTTQETTEVTTSPTIEDGNGPISTDATDNARSRNGMYGGTGSGNGITGSITG